MFSRKVITSEKKIEKKKEGAAQNGLHLASFSHK